MMRNLFLLVLACTLHGGWAFVQVLSPSVRWNLALQQSTPTEPASSSMNDDSLVEKQPNLPCPHCDICDGSGRIAGGIGAVIDWIPIKAYRPCPNYKGTYQKAGQGLDEIAFGRDSTFDKNNQR